MVHSWDEFLDFASLVETDKPTTFGDGNPIQTIVIDVVDLLFRMCQEDTCSTLGIESPSELSHGKGWDRLYGEFVRVISKMRRWPYGLVVISHERDREFKTKGKQTHRKEPDIGQGGFRALSSLSDLILYAHSNEHTIIDKATGEIQGTEEKRTLLCHPTSWAVAGGRMSHLLPEMIELDYETLNSHLLAGIPPTSSKPKTTTTKRRTKRG